jgi:hypothetical protein
MLRLRHAPFLALAGVLGVSLSCSKDRPFAGYVTDSQFFEYHQREASICSSLMTLLDEHARAIGGKIGLGLTPGDRYRYYKFDDLADFDSSQHDCGLDWGGCALGDALYSTQPFHAHEQAHDYVYRAWGGWSIGLFNEGEAVALSCDPYFLPLTFSPAPEDWRSAINLYHTDLSGYYEAGIFVTYLAAHYGWSSVAQLHSRVPPGSSAADVEAGFAAVYPVSLDDAWKASQLPANPPTCETDWVCDGTPLAVGEQASADCDGEVHRRIDVSDDSGFVLAVTGSDVSLTPCGAWQSSYAVWGGDTFNLPGAVHWANVPAGSYAVSHFLNPPSEGVTYQAVLHGPIATNDCGAATVVALDPQNATIVDIPFQGQQAWVRIDGTGGTFQVSTYSWSGSPMAVCAGCAADASCVPLTPGEWTSVTIGQGAAVQLGGAIPVGQWGQLMFEPPSP